jgi:hypothetical protein
MQRLRASLAARRERKEAAKAAKVAAAVVAEEESEYEDEEEEEEEEEEEHASASAASVTVAPADHAAAAAGWLGAAWNGSIEAISKARAVASTLSACAPNNPARTRPRAAAGTPPPRANATARGGHTTCSSRVCASRGASHAPFARDVARAFADALETAACLVSFRRRSRRAS